jgi:hypothetical protein
MQLVGFQYIQLNYWIVGQIEEEIGILSLKTCG